MTEISIITAIVAITGTMASAVVWICRSMFVPLRQSINSLSKIIERLQMTLDVETRERHELEIHVQQVDDRCRSLQHRVDSIEQRR